MGVEVVGIWGGEGGEKETRKDWGIGAEGKMGLTGKQQ